MSYTTVQYHSLKDRHVLITGGATGIGAEMVRAFAAQGSYVSFIDIDDDAAESLAGETGASYQRCDVTDTQMVRSTLAAFEEREGAFDAVINNAARDDRHDMFEVTTDYWDACMAVNLRHQFFVSQAAAKGMIAAGQGVILLLGSISWMRGRPGMVGYTTAKAAINGMTRTLAHELGPHGIRVNCLVPGAIHTERQLKWITPEANQVFLDRQALKFRLQTEHIARMALFLASDESDGCAAANFVVDAGLCYN